MSSKRTRTSLGTILGVSVLGFGAILFAINKTPQVIEKTVIVEKPVIKEVIREVEKKPVPPPSPPQRTNERPKFIPAPPRCDIAFDDKFREFERLRDNAGYRITASEIVHGVNSPKVREERCDFLNRISLLADKGLEIERDCDQNIKSFRIIKLRETITSFAGRIEQCRRDGYL